MNPILETMVTTERLLSETFGVRVRLGEPNDLGGSRRTKVYRFRLFDPVGNLPASVIVKQAYSTTESIYSPDLPTMPAWTFFNDWASLQFLNQLGSLSRLQVTFLRFHILFLNGSVLRK